MRRAEFHPAAQWEFDRALDRYEAERRGLGIRFKSVVEGAVRAIERNQLAGFPSELETRTLLVRRFPYKIVFRDFRGHLVILAVAHHRRAPEYWYSRADDA